jgi:hypothetical protein
MHNGANHGGAEGCRPAFHLPHARPLGIRACLRRRTRESNLGSLHELFTWGAERASLDEYADAATFIERAKELALLTLYEQRINRSLAHNTDALEERQAARREVQKKPRPLHPQ